VEGGPPPRGYRRGHDGRLNAAPTVERNFAAPASSARRKQFPCLSKAVTLAKPVRHAPWRRWRPLSAVRHRTRAGWEGSPHWPASPPREGSRERLAGQFFSRLRAAGSGRPLSAGQGTHKLRQRDATRPAGLEERRGGHRVRERSSSSARSRRGRDRQRRWVLRRRSREGRGRARWVPWCIEASANAGLATRSSRPVRRLHRSFS